jgi:hypothetical protein
MLSIGYLVIVLSIILTMIGYTFPLYGNLTTRIAWRCVADNVQ